MHGDGQPAGSGSSDLARHRLLHDPVSDCPLTGGNRVVLLPNGAEAIRAIMAAIAAATHFIHLEYYTVADVVLDGRSLFDLLEAKVRDGVEVAMIWDAIGSGSTPDAQFDRLEAAGVKVLEYHSINPLRRLFNWSVNDRDHRKLTVVDGLVGFLGGVNLSKVYETPESMGRGVNPDAAFWIDNAVRIEGPAVGEIEKLFRHTWDGQGGGHLPRTSTPPEPERAPGSEFLRVDGSAPLERRPLYQCSVRAALRGARRHFILATGYFVPTSEELALLAQAARRGVEVDLLLAGYSDVQPAVHAARATYGGLLRAGVRIHEVQRGMLHAKVATSDGVWTAIGSSNFDRRSVYFNNEIDAIVLGHATAQAVEAMLRAEIAKAVPVSWWDWQARSLRERALETTARAWKQLM